MISLVRGFDFSISTSSKPSILGHLHINQCYSYLVSQAILSASFGEVVVNSFISFRLQQCFERNNIFFSVVNNKDINGGHAIMGVLIIVL
jgi:hypothetical protein